MKKRRIFIGVTLSILLVTAFLLSSTANGAPGSRIVHPVPGNYNEQPEPFFKANSPTDISMAVEEIQKHINLRPGGRQIYSHLVSWSDYVQFAKIGQGQVDGTRKVWVVQTYYPEGFQTKRGFQLNCEVTAAYDGLSGKLLAVIYRSLPPGQAPTAAAP